MFEFLKRRAPVEQIVADLGKCTSGIMDAALEDDVRAALEGAGAVAVLIRTVHEHYGVKLAADSAFGRYMDSVKRQDVVAMAEGIRSFARILDRKTTDVARGAEIYCWITGVYTGLR